MGLSFLLCFLLSMIFSIEGTSYVETFMSSINRVSGKITTNIPNWYDYAYDEKSYTSLGTGGADMFKKGGEIKYLEIPRPGSKARYRAKPITYGETYSPEHSSFDFVSRASHPFVALMWIKNQQPKMEKFAFTVESELYDDHDGSFKNSKGSIISYSLNITYHAFQVYGSSPSIVEVYFYVEGTAWKSIPGKLKITNVKENSTYTLFKRIQVSDFPQNVLIGYMLLSINIEEEIEENKIQETMRYILDSFQRVLCNPNQTPCDENEFDCRCGKDIYLSSYPERHCILKSWRCDGTPDCPDGRDEENCVCEEGFFQCGCERGGECKEDFHCIPMSQICDGVDDCENAKDERTNQCAFNCFSGEVIKSSKQCDGKIDCLKASDEWACTYILSDRPNRCACNKQDNFTCTTGYTYFSDDEKCDGKKDCSDFSDEWECEKCPDTLPYPCSCNGQEFTCSSGSFSCFNFEQQCDYVNHCGDGTDEAGCTKAKCSEGKPFPCNCNKYEGSTCFGDACYSEEDRCDGWMDCSDWTDEKNCNCPQGFPLRCACANEDDITCGTMLLFSGAAQNYAISLSCVSEWDTCDGIFDCPDQSDELCETCPTSRPNSCACKDTNSCYGSAPCFSESQRCDENFDCIDHSDEWNCNCIEARPLKCPCKNLQNEEVCTGINSCFTEEEQCDGYQTCKNWEDEHSCQIKNLNARACECNQVGKVTCIGKPFYDEKERCDGKLSCSDGTDEANCSSCTTFQPNKCACNNQTGSESSCNGTRPCYTEKGRCDGINDCGDWSDEWNCPSCPPSRPHRCNCSEDNNTCSEGPQCFRDEDACNGKYDCTDGTDEKICLSCPYYVPNRCQCQKNNSCNGTRICFLNEELCDGLKDCADASDEWGCQCSTDSSYLPCNCKKLRNVDVCVGVSSCYSEYKESCNQEFTCPDKSDEWNCQCSDVKPLTCDCKKLTTDHVCIGQDSCYSQQERCNTEKDCKDGSDELRCTCNETLEVSPFTVNYESSANNSNENSADYESFENYENTSCGILSNCPHEKLVSCKCFSANNPSCSREQGCISYNLVNNGAEDCIDGSDEPLVISRQTTSCGSCDPTIYRLSSLEACDVIGPDVCDNSTCVTVPALGCSQQDQCNKTNVICVSPCDSNLENCKSLFQCQDQSMILGFRFCDGAPHCADGSDEIKNGFGFKCQHTKESSLTCVLPQWNLYDGNSTQCFKQADACSNEENNNCFQCLDNKLKIFSGQVCDGIINCYDASDECLCKNNFLLDFCQELFLHDDSSRLSCGPINDQCVEYGASHIIGETCSKAETMPVDSNNTKANAVKSTQKCNTKFGLITPTYCDGRPECDDFEDECEKCDNKPVFCQSREKGQCSSFFRLGDRYCDGINDQAYKYLNDSICPKGFDEENCEKRFRCPAGSFLSIDEKYKDDGIINCDDGSDENLNIFSSSTEMIASPLIRYFIWIIALITIFGNAYVIITTIKTMASKKMKAATKLNHILIVNLAVADFLMGIYLIFISIKSVAYSRHYGDFDFIWRASAECTAAGSLAIISSESSCFFMSVLTTYRLINILFPVKALYAPIWPWKLLLLFVWLFSVLLAAIPALPVLADYFVYQAHFDSPFSKLALLNKSEIIAFACRHATLSNISLADRFTDRSWESISSYLAQTFPNYGFQTVGYYGETSLCMPRFYVDLGDPAWRFSIFIITINFISFMYVCTGYIALYKISSNRPIHAKDLDAANTKMQKRIARLLVTDFLCWIPVCIIAYIKLGTGIYLSNTVYSFTIAFLLPINSALNPLLYSSLFDKMLDKYVCRNKEKKSYRSSRSISMTESSQV